MSDGDILIVYAYLDTLAANARNVANSLAGSSKAMHLTFPNNPRVTNAYEHFVGGWERHRSKLHDSISSAADAIKAVSDSFAKVETELIDCLNG